MLSRPQKCRVRLLETWSRSLSPWFRDNLSVASHFERSEFCFRCELKCFRETRDVKTE